MDERPFPITSRWPNPDIFHANVELGLLSSVLRHVREGVERELAAIDELVPTATLDDDVFEVPDVPDDFDWESAADVPLALMELTSRAVAYELVAIVEHRLHQLASEPWLTNSTFKGPKRVDDIPGWKDLSGDSLWDAVTRLKEVSRVPFTGNPQGRDICTLIQEHYAFRFEDLNGWPELLELREIVNSLKHQRGWKSLKRHRKTGWPKNLLERDDLGFDKAAKAIEDVRRFLIALEYVVTSSARPSRSTTPAS